MRSQLTLSRSAREAQTSLPRQLLMFSRQHVVEPKVLDLNAVIADTEKMLRRLIESTDRLRYFPKSGRVVPELQGSA